MHMHHRPATALLPLAVLGLAMTASPISAQDAGLQALDGDWVYLEDRTQDRPVERMGPPMSATFSMSVEEGAIVLVRGHGSGHRDVRVALDGSVTEVVEEAKTSRYTGAFEDGAFTYTVEFLRGPDKTPGGQIRRSFRHTEEGLVVSVTARSTSIGIYRHAEDIPMPTPAEATIDDLAWLSGAWVGTRGSSAVEERWGPPSGGSMLGTSRTIRNDALRAFEYLRVVERDGGLVYVAQPGGRPGTEFVLSELSPTRAVFANPRHDYPKRIAYELTAEGKLTATIGFMVGGSPRRFEFQREGE